jgi:hypothetical protein
MNKALTVCFNNKYHRSSVLISCLFSGHIRGNGGCKLKTIESRTNCKVFVNRFKPATGRMKVTIEIQNEESDPNNAVTRLIGSIMEYTKDKHTDWRLLCEMLPSCGKGYVNCSNFKHIPLLDPERAKRVSHAKLLNLPQRDHVYHGKCLLSSHELTKAMTAMNCRLKVFLDPSVGHPKCNPYAIVYGPTKAQVINATGAVKQCMRRHQQKCQCKPLW